MGFVAVLILAVGIVFVVALASGGGDDTSNPASSGTSTPKKASNGNICSGNTLITFGQDPASVLDPIQVRDEGTNEYIVEIYGGLVTLGLDLSVQPDIAKSWDISQDGKTYTFHLRDNVVFSGSGKRVTANDFKYSWERAADPKNNSPTVTTYMGLVAGLTARFNNKASDISGVKVIDDQTLQVQISQPAAYFLSELTYPVAFVVNKSQIDSNPQGWTQKPDGTGPFKVKSFSPAESIVLIRNDRYHLDKAKLDEVDFELSGGSIVTQYQNNEIHIGGVPPQELDAVKAGTDPLSKDYRPQNQMALSYIAFNFKQAPFDDPKVRQAMAMAIDRDQINSVVLFDSQRIADGILPPEMPGYNAAITSLQFDRTKAKALLASSKYAGNMPRITLTYVGTGGDSPEILQAIQAQWKDVLGIDIQLQASEYSAYLRDLRKGTYQMFDAGWAADYPDPEDFLSKLFATGSAQNEEGYSDSTVDGWLQQASAEPDAAKRSALYSQAEQKIIDDAVVIPTFWPVAHFLVKPCVKDWPQVSMSVEKYRYISIDPNAK
jgi:oligopeptide transport system substrate-binding protein